jgi:hypothetical protein
MNLLNELLDFADNAWSLLTPIGVLGGLFLMAVGAPSIYLILLGLLIYHSFWRSKFILSRTTPKNADYRVRRRKGIIALCEGWTLILLGCGFMIFYIYREIHLGMVCGPADLPIPITLADTIRLFYHC